MSDDNPYEPSKHSHVRPPGRDSILKGVVIGILVFGLLTLLLSLFLFA